MGLQNVAAPFFKSKRGVKVKKRFLGLILICVVIISLIPSVSFAEKRALGIKNKGEMLEGLGIIKHSDFFDDYVLYSDFLRALIKEMGKPAGKTDEELKAYAVSESLINNDAGLTTEIKTADAIELVVKALGYDDICNMENVTYLNKASEIGVLSGVDTAREYLSGEDGINLLYNILNAEVMLLDSDKNIYYDSDYTVMSGILKIHRSSGLVTAVKGMHLYGKEVKKDDIIAVNSRLYKTEADNLFEYFGKRVTYFYKTDDNDEKIILYMEYDEDDELTVKKENIEHISYFNSRLSLKYWEEGKLKNTEPVISFICYNGKAIDSSQNIRELTDIEDGEIQLIDNDNDSEYDILMIWERKTYFVSNINSKKIADKNGNDIINFDFEDDNKTYYFAYDGEEAGYSDIKLNTVLSVYESADKSLYRFDISEESFSGKLTACWNDGEDTKVKIDGEVYTSVLPTDSFKNGIEANFYLDKDGRIAGIGNEDTLTDEYAWLIKAYQNEDGGITFTMLTRYDGICEFSTEDSLVRVTVPVGDGKNLKSSVKTEKCNFEGMKTLVGVGSDGKIVPQLIKYKAQDKVIKNITVARDFVYGNNDFNKFKTVKNEAYANGNFAGGVVGKDTWIISVPPEEEKDKYNSYNANFGLVNEVKYNAEIYEANQNIELGVIVVKTETNKDLIKGSDVPNTWPTNVSVIKNIKLDEYYDDETEEVRKRWIVTAHNNSGEKEYYVKYSTSGLCKGSVQIQGGDYTASAVEYKTLTDTTKGDFLNVGDIGSLAVRNGTIYGIMVMYDAKYDIMIGQSNGVKPNPDLPYASLYEIPSGHNISTFSAGWDEGLLLYGKVVSVTDSSIVFNVENDKITEGSAVSHKGYSAYPAGKTQKGVAFSKKDANAQVITISDVMPGEEIVYVRDGYSFRGFVVFRDEVE